MILVIQCQFKKVKACFLLGWGLFKRWKKLH